MSKMKLALDVVQDLRELASSIEALANAATDERVSDDVASEKQPDTAEQPAAATMPTTPTTAPEKKITLTEVRAYVAERSTPENRPKIKAILGKFGVNKLTELSGDKYAVLMDEVAAL